MANDLSALIYNLQTRALPTLRENAQAVKMVTREFVGQGRKGQTIDFPVPAAQAVSAVTSGVSDPSNVDHTPTVKQVTLDQHFETYFHISDAEATRFNKDLNYIPGQMAEGVKALGNKIDQTLLENVKYFGYSAGTAGTTPFATEALLATAWQKGARKQLSTNLAPMGGRNAVIDEDADGNLASLTMFTDADRRGDTLGIGEAFIGRKLGANWVMDQNVHTHTSSGSTGNLINDASHAVGATNLDIDGGTGTIVVGDLITIAGDTQTYSVTSVTGSAPATNIGIFPASKVALADDAAITVVGTRVCNAAFVPTALGLATATFEDVDPRLGLTSQIVDPVTGIAIRLEVKRQHRQNTFYLDALWGTTRLQDGMGVQILG